MIRRRSLWGCTTLRYYDFVRGLHPERRLQGELSNGHQQLLQGAHPVCLWQDTKKLPVQAATADDAKTEGYDALTDAGLLTRTTAEKKVFIVASKQVNNYDLSARRA